MNSHLFVLKNSQTSTPCVTDHHCHRPREASYSIESSSDSLSFTTAGSSISSGVRPDAFDLPRPRACAQARKLPGERNDSGDGRQSLCQAEAVARAVFRTGAKAHLAIATATKAVQQNPADPKALVLRGLLHRQNGSNHEAISDFDAALRIDSSNRTALLHRAAVMHNPSLDFEARKFLENTENARNFALGVQGDRFAILLLIVDWCVFRKGDTESILARKLLDANPYDRCAMSALLTMEFCQFQMFNSSLMETSALLSASNILKLWPDDKIAQSVVHHCSFKRSEQKPDSKANFQKNMNEKNSLYEKHEISPRLILTYPLIEQDSYIFSFLGG